VRIEASAWQTCRKPRAVHDPGNVALAVTLGGDCLVASAPTVCRLIDTLAASGDEALGAIRTAQAEVRARVWPLDQGTRRDTGSEVTVDLDGVLVIAHSDKPDAAPT